MVLLKYDESISTYELLLDNNEDETYFHYLKVYNENKARLYF